MAVAFPSSLVVRLIKNIQKVPPLSATQTILWQVLEHIFILQLRFILFFFSHVSIFSS